MLAAAKFVLVNGLLLLPSFAFAQNATTAEYVSKATFLSNFPAFVEWPNETFSSPSAPFLICVYGDFSFGTSLAELTRSTKVNERKIGVRWIHKEQELRTCQLLFVSKSEEKKYAKILENVQGASVLTVGETPAFLPAGGMMSFSLRQTTLQFDVNLEAVTKVHLRISSRLLALARQVINKQADDRS